MKVLLDKTIGEIITEDFRTATLFKDHNLDSFCGKHHTLRVLCQLKNINPDQFSAEIQHILSSKWKNEIHFQAWPPDLLIHYIVKKHHRYIRKNAPVLVDLLQKIAAIHGSDYPELYTVYRMFKEAANALIEHINKEEEIVFPFIEKMNHMILDGSRGRLEHSNNPLDMLIAEHGNEEDRFGRIATISNGYCPPPDACNTYRITYAMLKEFDNELRTHAWLENEVLVPKAISLEQQLLN